MGCCDNDAPINFSLLMIPSDFPLNLKDIKLWAAAVIMYLAAYLKTVAYFVLRKKEMHESNVITSFVVTLTSQVIVIISFFKGITDQPEAECLQSNLCLYCGYLCFVLGALMSANGYGCILIKGHRLLDEQKAEMFSDYRTECGVVLLVLGLSVVKASVAGGILASFTALSIFSANTFKSDLLKATSSFIFGKKNKHIKVKRPKKVNNRKRILNYYQDLAQDEQKLHIVR